jgi:hypothetical protein
MKCVIAGLLVIVSCSVWASDCPTPPMACCEPIPTTWHLGTPIDASALRTAVGDDAEAAFIKSIPLGEKIVPYSDTPNKDGHAAGGWGYALIRRGCLIQSFQTLVF